MDAVVIGDVHGSIDQLTTLLAIEELFLDRNIIFLGDYVDVGPHSKEVIERLLTFGASRKRVRFLKGNHDIALLDYLIHGNFNDYAANGGIPTIRSYCGEVIGDVHEAMVRSVPHSHVDFLTGLDDYVETEDYLFSHAGYDPVNPSDRSLRSMVLTSHQALFERATALVKTSVCGHYFQESRLPFVRERLICLDTGCGMVGGPLTALSLPERRGVQVWPDLRVITI